MSNVLELLILLFSAGVFVAALHRWSESGDRSEPLVPWLNRDEAYWMDDEEYEREDQP